MKKIKTSILALALLAILGIPSVHAGRPVTLANDEWPPFIVANDSGGTSNRLVCEALERSGHSCTVKVEPWEKVLEEARNGSIDGIAAAWQDTERESFLLFSKPYLSNHIIPVVPADSDASIKSVDDLAGLRVALVKDFAYGDEIESVAASFETIPAGNSVEAMEQVRLRRADVALVDELEARDRMVSNRTMDLVMLKTVLAYRSLHFAVSRATSDAEELMADFDRAYETMLLDGTVNEILEIDWIATDFGDTGNVNVILREGVSLDDLANPSKKGSVFALDQAEYDWTDKGEKDQSRVKYQVKGESYSTLQSALNTVFGEETVCEHKEYSSTFDCSDIFKKADP